jgi:type IV pilus assembly protein PilO
MDLNELTIENIAEWPPLVRWVSIGTFAVILSAFVIYFDTKNQIETLGKEEKKEMVLRRDFEGKQQKSVNLEKYKIQLRKMKISFGTLLRQLPEKTEVPGLLEDISKTGLANGLEFTLFKPLPEAKKEFYAELPIQITVIGDYHRLANFISQIAALPRIVTFHDFRVQSWTIANKNKSFAGSVTEKIKPAELLQMDITAKTYRYIEN